MAKEIDASSHCLRAALDQAIELMEPLTNNPSDQHGVSSLKEARALRGFSSPALDAVHQTLSSLLIVLSKTGPRSVSKHFCTIQKQIASARVTLEQAKD